MTLVNLGNRDLERFDGLPSVTPRGREGLQLAGAFPAPGTELLPLCDGTYPHSSALVVNVRLHNICAVMSLQFYFIMILGF